MASLPRQSDAGQHPSRERVALDRIFNAAAAVQRSDNYAAGLLDVAALLNVIEDIRIHVAALPPAFATGADPQAGPVGEGPARPPTTWAALRGHRCGVCQSHAGTRCDICGNGLDPDYVRPPEITTNGKEADT
jgi:hypothetical protein